MTGRMTAAGSANAPQRHAARTVPAPMRSVRGLTGGRVRPPMPEAGKARMIGPAAGAPDEN